MRLDPPDPAVPPSGSEVTEVDVSVLADRIDPGPQSPLLWTLSPSVHAAIGIPELGSVGPREALRRANHELVQAHLPSSPGDTRALEGVVALLRCVALAERAIDGGQRDALVVVEQAYHGLTNPVIQGVTPRLMQMWTRVDSAHGRIDLMTAFAGIRGALDRASAAHRRSVASLLRSSEDPETIADALERVAPSLRREDDGLGVEVAKASVSLRSEAVRWEHLFALANVCYAALDARCGERALAQALRLYPRSGSAQTSFRRAANQTRTLAGHARAALEGPSSVALDSRLRYARALLELGRHEDARGEYVRLRSEFPREAAPVTGLARLAVIESWDFGKASTLIAEASEVQHADDEYYEIAIGCTGATVLAEGALLVAKGSSFGSVMNEIEPGVRRLRSYVRQYEEHGNPVGLVSGFVLDVAVAEVVPAIDKGGIPALAPVLRSLLPRIAAVRDRVPNEVSADLLLAGLAQFSDDEHAAFAALQRRPPNDPKGVAALRRTRAWFELVTTWDATEQVPGLIREADRLDDAWGSATTRLLAADARAVAARLQRRAELWEEVTPVYRDVVEADGSRADPRLRNNLAVALVEQGNVAEAIELLRLAVKDAGSNVVIARVNLAVLERGPGHLATLDSEAWVAATPDERLFAARWRVALAPPAEQSDAERRFTEQLERERTRTIRPRVLPGAAGVILEGTLGLEIGYSPEHGLMVAVPSESKPWLVLVPPPRSPISGGATPP